MSPFLLISSFCRHLPTCRLPFSLRRFHYLVSSAISAPFLFTLHVFHPRPIRSIRPAPFPFSPYYSHCLCVPRLLSKSPTPTPRQIISKAASRCEIARPNSDYVCRHRNLPATSGVPIKSSTGTRKSCCRWRKERREYSVGGSEMGF